MTDTFCGLLVHMLVKRAATNKYKKKIQTSCRDNGNFEPGTTCKYQQSNRLHSQTLIIRIILRAREH